MGVGRTSGDDGTLGLVEHWGVVESEGWLDIWG